MLRRSRALEDRPQRTRSHATKLIAIICLGLGLVTDQIGLLVMTFIAGAIGLWMAFRRDDVTTDSAVAEFFDDATGLPLATAMPHVLGDDLAMRTLTGRMAVIMIEVPEMARRSVAGDHGGASAMLAAISHRLRSHSWAEAAEGPFGSLFFLQRPGAFIIVRRDVLDDRTTRWLAEKLIAVVNKPIAWSGTVIEPDAILGAAAGPVSEVAALPTLATEARNQARRGRPGSVVILHRDRPTPTPPEEATLVSFGDGAAVGRVFGRTGSASSYGMFEDFSGLIRTLDRALNANEHHESTVFISVSATSLSHPDAVVGLVSRVNMAEANGRVGVVLPAEFPTSASHRAVRAVRTLHDSGFSVYADRVNPSDRSRPLPDCPIDGVMVGSAFEAAPNPDAAPIATADCILSQAVAARDAVLVRRLAGVQAPSMGIERSMPGLNRPIWPGHATHLATDSGIAVR